MAAWVNKHLTSECFVFSDGYNCFRSIKKNGFSHSALTIGKEYHNTGYPGLNQVNRVVGNVKNFLSGTLYSHKTNSTGCNLSIYQYRSNRRFDLKTLLPKINSKNCKNSSLS